MNSESVQKKDSTLLKEVGSAAGILMSAWAFNRFPKVAVVTLLGVGVLIGLTAKDLNQRMKH